MTDSQPQPFSIWHRGATLALVGLMACAATSAIAQVARPFTVSSPDLVDGKFPIRFTLGSFGCTGENISPEIRWENAPPGTQSFALQVVDLDAPDSRPFWHWALYNIPANLTGLPRGAGTSSGSLPVTVLKGANDFHDTGATGSNGNYGGPCPPVGDKPHRYVFNLYALAVPDVQVAAGVPKSGTPALYSFVLNKALGAGLLGKATFTAEFGR